MSNLLVLGRSNHRPEFHVVADSHEAPLDLLSGILVASIMTKNKTDTGEEYEEVRLYRPDAVTGNYVRFGHFVRDDQLNIFTGDTNVR
jgi:hypothetical protein